KRRIGKRSGVIVDRERLAAIVSGEPLAHARREFGDDGATALTALVGALRKIYEHVAPEQLVGGMTVVQALSLCTPGKPLPADLPEGEVELATPQALAETHRDALTIIFLPNRRLRVLSAAVDPTTVSDEAVVYHFNPNDGEYFVVGCAAPVRPGAV